MRILELSPRARFTRRHGIQRLVDRRPDRVPHLCYDLMDAVLDLLLDGEPGCDIWRMPGPFPGPSSRGCWQARWVWIPRSWGAPAASFGWAAERPVHAPLATERGRIKPSLENAVDRYSAVLREAQFEPSLAARPAQSATESSRAEESTGPQANTSSTDPASVLLQT